MIGDGRDRRLSGSAKVAVMVVLLSAASMFLASCGGNAAVPPSSGSSEAATMTPLESVSNSPSTLASPSPSQLSGLVLVTCAMAAQSSQRFDVQLLNIEGGSDTPISGFSADTKMVACPSMSFSADRVRQRFDQSYLRMTTAFTSGADNSQRVGWLSATGGGKLFDVSAITTPGGDFAAAPKHVNPLYTPAGEFSYYDQSSQKVVYTDANTGKPLRSAELGSYFSPYFFDRGGRVKYAQDFDELGRCTTTLTADGALELQVASSNPIWAWLDETRAFQTGENGEITVVKAEPVGKNSLECSVPGTPITPKSDFKIVTVLASKDKTQVFFIAQRGTEMGLYTVPVDGSSAPKKLRSLNFPDGTYPYLTEQR